MLSAFTHLLRGVSHFGIRFYSHSKYKIQEPYISREDVERFIKDFGELKNYKFFSNMNNGVCGAFNEIHSSQKDDKYNYLYWSKQMVARNMRICIICAVVVDE